MSLIHRALVALLLVLGLTAFSPTPAQAADPIPPEFGVSGWWNNPSDPNASTPEEKWTYPNFPINCLGSPGSTPAWQVFWITKQGQSNPSLMSTNPADVRKLMRRVASIFAASNEKVLSADKGNEMTDNRTPRFITWMDGGSNCHVQFTQLVAPASVLDGDPWVQGELWDWLVGQGYNRQDRKYLILLQAAPPNGATYGGVAECFCGDTTPGKNNLNNKGPGFAWVKMPHLASNLHFYADVIVHEMTHAIGAVLSNSPHYNSQNPAHPTDCAEILCYGAGTPGESTSACGAYGFGNPQPFRLDCNNDDYFYPNYNPNIAYPRWLANNNSFLWYNSLTFYHSGLSSSPPPAGWEARYHDGVDHVDP